MKKEDLIEMEEADCCFFADKPQKIFSADFRIGLLMPINYDEKFWWVKANPKQDPEDVWGQQK